MFDSKNSSEAFVLKCIQAVLSVFDNDVDSSP